MQLEKYLSSNSGISLDTGHYLLMGMLRCYNISIKKGIWTAREKKTEKWQERLDRQVEKWNEGNG